MNAKQIGLAVVFVDFVALTAYAVYHHGYLAFFDAFFGDAIGVQVFFDLVIVLVLFMVWMWKDADERGISPLPYAATILCLGSIGALAYMIRRESYAPRRVVDTALAH